MMIGFVIRELTYLKVLQPIIQEAIKRGCAYVVYYMDCPHGAKEYNRPTAVNMKSTFGGQAVRLIPFSTDSELKGLLLRDRVDRFVSIEVGLFKHEFGGFWHANGIKVYSIAYLTDTLWQPSSMFDGLDRFYYTSKYLMELHHKFSGTKYDSTRDRCLGSPLFDGLTKLSNTRANKTLVLLPSVYEADLEAYFGTKDYFLRLMRALGPDLLLKTRKKHWVPYELGQTVAFDDERMVYPPITTQLFEQTHTTVMFLSSGVYEAVCANQYVVNVNLPTNYWPWNQQNMLEYFSGSAYNYGGVVKSVEQEELLSGLEPHTLNQTARKEWLALHTDNVELSSSELILEDILK